MNHPIRSVVSLALISLAVLSCQAGPVSTAAKVIRKTTSTATAASVRTLVGPPGTIRVSGTLTLDASYAVTHAGGSLLTTSSGQVTAPDGGKLTGTTVISNDGGSIVAQGGGNVILDNAPVVSNDGGSIVAQGGGNVISNDGGSIISQDGNGALAGAAAFHTLSTEASLPIGTVLPAVGMVVQVRTLQGNTRVTVGTDATSKAAYAVYTNLAGKFELFLPASQAGNVVIFATPRVKTDRKLRYNVIGMSSATASINEDTSQATRYTLGSITSRVQQLLMTDPAKVSGLAPVFGAFDGQIATVAAASHVPAAAIPALAEEVTDTLMASIDLSKATFTDASGSANTSCLLALTNICNATRGNMQDRMQALQKSGQDPTAVMDAQSWFAPGVALGLKIEKPADFLDFLVATKLGDLTTDELTRAQAVHQAVLDAGLPTDDTRLTNLYLSSVGLLAYCGQVLDGAPKVTTSALDLIRKAGVASSAASASAAATASAK